MQEVSPLSVPSHGNEEVLTYEPSNLWFGVLIVDFDGSANDLEDEQFIKEVSLVDEEKSGKNKASDDDEQRFESKYPMDRPEVDNFGSAVITSPNEH